MKSVTVYVTMKEVKDSDEFLSYYQMMYSRPTYVPTHLLIQSQQELLFYNYQNSPYLSTLHISEGVNEIDDDLFMGCSLLHSIKLIGVKNIKCHAFLACGNLQYIEISDSIQHIHEDAFKSINQNIQLTLRIPLQFRNYFLERFPSSQFI